MLQGYDYTADRYSHQFLVYKSNLLATITYYQFKHQSSLLGRTLLDQDLSYCLMKLFILAIIMEDHKLSVAVSLLVFSLLCFLQVNCQQSGFRVFRTGAELREFQQFTARERLDNALMFPGTAILEITGASQAATIQEGTSLYIDCLPWLQRFRGGSIQWRLTLLDEFRIPPGM